jgi:hypothetical protein
MAYLAQRKDSINYFISPRVVDHHEDGGRRFLRNFGIHIPVNRASYTGRLKFSHSFHIAKTYRLVMFRDIITVLNIAENP